MDSQDNKKDVKNIKKEQQVDFESPQEIYQTLINTIHRYHPSDDISQIERAYRIANYAHRNQFRKSGEPYIVHPLRVAIILAELELDKETIIAGLLHDIVEDTVMTEEELDEEFGEEVTLLVDGVTKLSMLSYSQDKIEVQAENLRKMFMAMANDIRVIIIKLADRLHNMRTMQFMPPAKQIEKSKETLDIYAPIAHRLGISKLKVELDDLALKYIHPEVYEELKENLSQKKSEREEFVSAIVAEVSEHMKNMDIEAEVYGRVKHFFSIYKKMVNKHKTIDQIYDLFAIRIIVEDLKDCYGALGSIHDLYKPIPGRFKDYIAMPKTNRYQSLHTAVISKSGQPFEVQIRTKEMHRTAEYGIAAHWMYKEGHSGHEGQEAKMTWLRQILEWQQDMSDNAEFMHFLKSDLDAFAEYVYCFTPSGHVKTLPSGSTPIDFAYSVHSDIGNKMIGAKINGKNVPNNHVLQNGDIVEIHTSANFRGPSRDWLHIVKSSQAKNKINQWFKNEYKEENILRGKELFDKYCKSKSININEIMKPEYMKPTMKKYGYKDWDAVYAALGHGGLKEGQIANRMLEELYKQKKTEVTDEDVLEHLQLKERPKSNTPSTGIIVTDVDDVAVRFSKCCLPVPGDEIVGFVTRGRGVSVHRKDCMNVNNLSYADKLRLIDASWQNSNQQTAPELYVAEMNIYCSNKVGMFVEISKALSEMKINMTSINGRTNKQGIGTITVAIEIVGKDQLDKVVNKLMNIDGIIDIERSMG